MTRKTESGDVERHHKRISATKRPRIDRELIDTRVGNVVTTRRDKIENECSEQGHEKSLKTQEEEEEDIHSRNG